MANKEIEDFITDLQKCEQIFSEPVENIYSSKTFVGAENNVNNLRLYLNKMFELKPKYMIVGEAPGYRGCRWSGIPFTSEKTIVTNGFFNQEYKVRNKKKPQSETSATRVWNCFKELKEIPLIWNAFPFHPYYKDNVESNRPLNSEELSFGKEKLETLIEIFNIDKANIIAVGEKAQKCLALLFIKEVVHPAARGITTEDFINSMKAVIK